jgi:hypothetical protein
MAKTKKKSTGRAVKRSKNEVLYVRLIGLVVAGVSGYLFWQSVSMTSTDGTTWWITAMVEAVLLLCGLYILTSGKAAIHELVKNL